MPEIWLGALSASAFMVVVCMWVYVRGWRQRSKLQAEVDAWNDSMGRAYSMAPDGCKGIIWSHVPDGSRLQAQIAAASGRG